MDDSDNSAEVSSILRAGALAIIALQIGYMVLDRIVYPHNFARTSPFHLANVALGLIAFVTTLSPCAMRNWRAISLSVYTAIIASTAFMTVIDGDCDPSGRVDSAVFLRRRRDASVELALAGGARSGRQRLR